jgi:arabinan endo-1,5-alpha-L-arabinosidase
MLPAPSLRFIGLALLFFCPPLPAAETSPSADSVPVIAQPATNVGPAAATADASRAAEMAARLAQHGNRKIRVHDPSTIVQCKDEYWLFYTGRGISSFHSKDLVQWQAGPRVFTNAPAWTAEAVPGNRGLSYWAPDIIFVNNRYLLYYSVSTFGKITSAIGVAANPTLDPTDPAFHWTDLGPVVQSHEGMDFNTIDPSVMLDADGRLWMAFGSFWSGIKLIQLDPGTGRRLAPDSPMCALAHASSIEAACLCHHDGFYYLLVDWGICCKGVDSTYNIRIGRSRTVTGPYVDKDGRDLRASGGTAFLVTDAPFIGPGHAGILKQGDQYWLSCHFYDGTASRGPGTLAISPLQWDTNGWPAIGVSPHY